MKQVIYFQFDIFQNMLGNFQIFNNIKIRNND